VTSDGGCTAGGGDGVAMDRAQIGDGGGDGEAMDRARIGDFGGGGGGDGGLGF